MLSEDIQLSIAAIVVTAKLPQDMPFGTCLIRSLLGKAVFDLCHVPARLIAGGMLYRVGKHRRRDTLRFCLPDNTGGFMTGNFHGHVWLEVGDDIVDFSAGDWVHDTELMYEHLTHPEDIALGQIEWQVEPPPFIWLPTQRTGWRSKGQPVVGEIWYGPWSKTHRGPWVDGVPHDSVLEDAVRSHALAQIATCVKDFRLRERIAACGKSHSQPRTAARTPTGHRSPPGKLDAVQHA